MDIQASSSTPAPTILLVDDNAPFRMLLRAFLHKAGYRTVEAANGEEAMAMLEREAPRLVLLDLQMQPLGGFDFMHQYNDMGHKMPVLLITGDPSSDILTRATKLGFAGVVKKPITEERIVPMVQRLLSV